VSELLTHNVDGFILDDPTDSRQLAEFIRAVYESAELRERVSLSATATARRYTWQRNAEEMKRILDECLLEKRRNVPDKAQSALTQA
jgi:glycosyltransferase involved in cell wall biosynthesis